jgi:hypothetical protein
MFILVCDANKDPQAVVRFRSLTSSFSTSTAAPKCRRSLCFHKFGPWPLGISPRSLGITFFQSVQARKLVRKAGMALPPSMMSNHWHLLRRAAIALIGSTVLVWHALAFSQPGLSKQMHSLPSYNPYSCPCYPDNHTGDLLLTPCSATTGCWFRPCTFRFCSSAGALL